MTDNGIKEEGAKYLAEVIKQNTTLKALKLWSKNIDDVRLNYMKKNLTGLYRRR